MGRGGSGEMRVMGNDCYIRHTHSEACYTDGVTFLLDDHALIE